MIYWQSHSMNTMGMFVCLSLTKKIHTYIRQWKGLCAVDTSLGVPWLVFLKYLIFTFSNTRNPLSFI